MHTETGLRTLALQRLSGLCFLKLILAFAGMGIHKYTHMCIDLHPGFINLQKAKTSKVRESSTGEDLVRAFGTYLRTNQQQQHMIFK